MSEFQFFSVFLVGISPDSRIRGCRHGSTGSLERQGVGTADRSEEVIAWESSLSITYSLDTSLAQLFDLASVKQIPLLFYHGDNVIGS